MPPEICAIVQQPGATWTQDERDRVTAWLREDRQCRRAIAVGKRILRSESAASRAWDNFYGHPRIRGGVPGDWVWPLNGTLRFWDPMRPRCPPGILRPPCVCEAFFNFVTFCFARYCQQRGQAERFDPLPPELPQGGRAVHADPEALLDCIRQLSGPDRALVEESYFKERTTTEISQRWCVPIGTVKARLHRVLLRLRTCLGEKGMQP